MFPLRRLIAPPDVEYSFGREFLSSIVVFLVALPLCIGVAAACGAPPALGLVTGIVGGMIVGWFAGSPLQVSGPAAGLIVLVAGVIKDFGLAALGVAVLFAGAIQLVAGLLKLGRWFRATSPAVIHGMLAGIGALIFGSQFHVMVDDKARDSGIANWLAIPEAIYKGIFPLDGSTHHMAALVGIVTIATIVLWDKFRPEKLKLVPGALLGVLTGTGLAMALGLPVDRIDIPASLTSALNIPGVEQFKLLADAKFVGEIFAIALIASAETLLCATAVDRMHSGTRTDYDRELAAQGVGNMVCGALGALPMTGVIVRSSANVAAGAKTRLSTIMHGTWLLLLVALAPMILSKIPSSALAAILVVIGYRLINVKEMKHLWEVSKVELAIYLITLFTIVFAGLLVGVMVGIALSALRLLWTFSRIQVDVTEEGENTLQVDLVGAATFVSLPMIAQELEALPQGKRVELDLSRLAYVDHACLELLQSWSKQYEVTGGDVVTEWDFLHDRFKSRRLMTDSKNYDGTLDGAQGSESAPAT